MLNLELEIEDCFKPIEFVPFTLEGPDDPLGATLVPSDLYTGRKAVSLQLEGEIGRDRFPVTIIDPVICTVTTNGVISPFIRVIDQDTGTIYLASANHLHQRPIPPPAKGMVVAFYRHALEFASFPTMNEPAMVTLGRVEYVANDHTTVFYYAPERRHMYRHSKDQDKWGVTMFPLGYHPRRWNQYVLGYTHAVPHMLFNPFSQKWDTHPTEEQPWPSNVFPDQILALEAERQKALETLKRW